MVVRREKQRFDSRWLYHLCFCLSLNLALLWTFISAMMLAFALKSPPAPRRYCPPLRLHLPALLRLPLVVLPDGI